MSRPAKHCVVVAAVCLMVACLVAACAGSGSDGGPTLAASYQTVPCPQPNIAGFPELDFPSGVQCGYLTVPENRARPNGRHIRIFVMRAPAVSAKPRRDPVVYLSGGPGGAGSFEVAFMLQHGINADREVIFVDQRGTHRADPLLACPGWEQFIFDAVSLPFAADSSTATDTEVVKACRDQLAATGVDLAAYNTTENAADIADLRVALGIDSWNVYGVSYGSRLALTVLRDHPQGIRSVVLDSVSPPTVNIVETWWSAPASSFKAIFGIESTLISLENPGDCRDAEWRCHLSCKALPSGGAMRAWSSDMKDRTADVLMLFATLCAEGVLDICLCEPGGNRSKFAPTSD